ncbi:aldo/keto reductase [uncultured Mesonia sp.]|uniref:aldo/keto reductase n=1 Tax=uncultured Mesonia sp. TaxID=399731 RepID=UPI00374E5F11
MELKNLGTTSIKIPPIVFGGNVFGWTADKSQSFKLLDELVSLGFNAIDTADVYSRWATGNQGGESEIIIGEWIQRNNNRDKISLFTKVGSNMRPGGEKNISKKYILKAVEDSLSRLKTDYIDLYFTHYDDYKTPVSETLSAYEQLIREGKVRHIGASNLSPERLIENLEVSQTENLPKYEVFQPLYNLLDREEFEKSIKAICKEHKLGVVSYFSLASGFLTGKYNTEMDFEGAERKRFAQKYLNHKNLSILNQMENIANEHQVSLAAVALRWIMQRPVISAPIASATNTSQLSAFREAISFKLSEEQMSILNNWSKA